MLTYPDNKYKLTLKNGETGDKNHQDDSRCDIEIFQTF